MGLLLQMELSVTSGHPSLISKPTRATCYSCAIRQHRKLSLRYSRPQFALHQLGKQNHYEDIVPEGVSADKTALVAEMIAAIYAEPSQLLYVKRLLVPSLYFTGTFGPDGRVKDITDVS